MSQTIQSNNNNIVPSWSLNGGFLIVLFSSTTSSLHKALLNFGNAKNLLSKKVIAEIKMKSLKLLLFDSINKTYFYPKTEHNLRLQCKKGRFKTRFYGQSISILILSLTAIAFLFLLVLLQRRLKFHSPLNFIREKNCFIFIWIDNFRL